MDLRPLGLAPPALMRLTPADDSRKLPPAGRGMRGQATAGDGMANPAGGDAARQGILSLTIKDSAALYRAYMAFAKGGGLFVPTAKRYDLGDEVFLLITLLDESERLPVPGKVVWITPPGAQGNRTAGIGIQFNDTAEGEAARTKIESILAGMLGSDRPTQTM
jgi:type IV pilus assembly protein PilZ